jgi:hypothetical protein
MDDNNDNQSRILEDMIAGDNQRSFTEEEGTEADSFLNISGMEDEGNQELEGGNNDQLEDNADIAEGSGEVYIYH